MSDKYPIIMYMEPDERITIRVPVGLAKAIDRMARGQLRTRSNMLRYVLEEYFRPRELEPEEVEMTTQPDPPCAKCGTIDEQRDIVADEWICLTCDEPNVQKNLDIAMNRNLDLPE